MRKLSILAVLLSGTALTPAYATQTEVDTNAALKALTGGVTTTAYRAGYYSAGDGGDALYAWNGSSSCTDDGGSCIQPNSGTGRWILNSNGAPSIKVFGAKCDSSTNDTTAINNALTAREAAYVPANSTCNVNMASASDGLKFGTTCSPCGSAHLFGQSKTSSVLQFNRSFTPSFDFVAAHQFVNIVVTSNVAVVNTRWSHQLKPGQTVTISGSATTGLNGTKTIRSIGSNPAQTDSFNSFSFATSGVSNGTYTDPTSITGQSGINIDAISSAQRDVNDTNKWIRFELDHLTLKATGTTIPMSWIDLTGSRDSSVHDMIIDTSSDTGTYSDNMQVMVRCLDRSPADYNKVSACFFAHVYDVNMVGAVTFLIQQPSANNNNNGTIYERLNGGAEAIADLNGNVQTNSLQMRGIYVNSDGSPLSTDFPGGWPAQTWYVHTGIEGAKTLTFQSSNGIAYSNATADDALAVENVVFGGQTVAGLDTCGVGGALEGQMTVVTDATSTTNDAALVGSGTHTVIAVCTAGGWKVH